MKISSVIGILAAASFTGAMPSSHQVGLRFHKFGTVVRDATKLTRLQDSIRRRRALNSEAGHLRRGLHPRRV